MNPCAFMASPLSSTIMPCVYSHWVAKNLKADALHYGPCHRFAPWLPVSRWWSRRILGLCHNGTTALLSLAGLEAQEAGLIRLRSAANRGRNWRSGGDHERWASTGPVTGNGTAAAPSLSAWSCSSCTSAAFPQQVGVSSRSGLIFTLRCLSLSGLAVHCARRACLPVHRSWQCLSSRHSFPSVLQQPEEALSWLACTAAGARGRIAGVALLITRRRSLHAEHPSTSCSWRLDPRCCAAPAAHRAHLRRHRAPPGAQHLSLDSIKMHKMTESCCICMAGRATLERAVSA